VSIEGIQNY